MVEFVDLMKISDGAYICANWCDEGRVEVRGDVCRKCQYDSAIFKVLHCAVALVERWSEAEDEDSTPWEIDLIESVEEYHFLKAEDKE